MKYPKKKIHHACGECGISANVLTCLKKYGRRPDKLCFECSTMHTGDCDYCGEEKSITEVRDYFYPDFNLLKNYERKIYPKANIHNAQSC